MKPQLLRDLKDYKLKNIGNDILSGLLVAIIALPLSIALGLQSVPETVGNGIQMGIITAIIAGFCISAFGGCKFQIGGPTAAFVTIIFGYLSDPEIGIIGLQIATIFAGVLLIMLGLLKCGSLVKFMPYPIIIGFTSGIGFTLLFGQIKDFCGISTSGAGFIEKISGYIENIKQFSLPTFLMGLGSLVIIYGLKKINKKIPSAFIAIILLTIINIIIDGESLGIATIGSKFGDIKAEFSIINFSLLSNVKFAKIIIPTITICFLGALESLLSATVADGISKTKSDFNQELLGQGVGNICSSIFGGLCATGAIARTSANISSGAKSCISGIFHAVFMLLMYLVLMPIVKYIPLCLLAGVLITVSINIFNLPLLIKMSKFGIRDTFVLYATMFLTIFFDLTYGVVGGITLAFITNIQNFKTGLKIENIVNDNKTTLKLNGTLYFITINKLVKELNKISETYNKIEVDFENVKRTDCTAIEKYIKSTKALKSKNIEISSINCNKSIDRRIKEYSVNF